MLTKPRRLFLALWPDAGERAQLAALSDTLSGGHKVHPDNLHLTLVFLGATDDERLLCYEQALRDLAVPPLTLRLDRLACWSRSGILWLGASRVPPELSSLVQDLNRRLEGCGFSPERRPFQAHITLARDFTGPAPPAELEHPVIWRTGQVALVESLQTGWGVRYAVLARWPSAICRSVLAREGNVLAREGNVQQPAEFASKLAPTDDAGKGSGISFSCTRTGQRFSA